MINLVAWQSVNCLHWRDQNVPGGGLCALGHAAKPSIGYCTKMCKVRQPHVTRDVLLKNRQGAGDQVMFTALVRDLQLSNPGRFRVAVDCWAMELFANNPYIVPREELSKDATEIKVEGFVAADDELPYLLHFHRILEQRLNITIKRTKIGGDVHLSQDEKLEAPKVPGDYWICWFGGHHGFSTKWWNPREAQKVVDHFKGRITFVQVGQPEHWHVPLAGVVDLRGKTPMRDMVKLMYHAQGGVGPISFGMHLAAAVPTKPGAAARRPYVVIAGGRESVPLNQYPTQTILSNVGGLRCCLGGACWKNVSHGLGGRRVDCEQPVEVWPEHQVTPDAPKGLRLARCMDMIKAEQVIAAIENYLHGIADARAAEERRKKAGEFVREITGARCRACPSFGGERSPKTVFCKLEEPCCGERGSVDLEIGRCPLDPPVWDSQKVLLELVGGE